MRFARNATSAKTKDSKKSKIVAAAVSRFAKDASARVLQMTKKSKNLCKIFISPPAKRTKKLNFQQNTKSPFLFVHFACVAGKIKHSLKFLGF